MGLTKTSNLTLECIAIGSLPYTDADEAMYIVEKYFPNIPFWPQLTNINKKEDMTIQFLEGMPSFLSDKDYLDVDYKDFQNNLTTFFNDYDKIISDKDAFEINKYAISKNCASAFGRFLHLIKNKSPKFAKGQISGPFTLLITLKDKNGTTAIHNPLYKEIIVKTLTIKALWQIRKIKKASAQTIPIIFIDEPALGKIALSDNTMRENVLSMIQKIAKTIQANGALCGVHCCAKCDWTIPISAEVDIISLDVFSYPEILSLYHNEIYSFLKKGGKLAFGIVPTREKDKLKNLTGVYLENKFKEAVKNLTNNGINEKIVIDNLVITPACGAGNLDKTLAQKAMKMTFEFSEKLKDIYSVR